MKYSLVLSSVASLALGGCMHLESSHYLTAPAVAARSEAPTVILEGAPIPDGAQELGILQAQCAGGRCDMPKVLDRLRQEAASVGATHVVHVRIDQGQTMLVAHGVAVAAGVWVSSPVASAAPAAPAAAPASAAPEAPAAPAEGGDPAAPAPPAGDVPPPSPPAAQ